MGRHFWLGALSGALGLAAIIGVVVFFALSRTSNVRVSDAESRQLSGYSGLYTPERLELGRTRLALEDPRIIQRFLTGGTFGGKASRLAGLHMFSRNVAVTDDIRQKTERFEVAPGTWFVRFPIVNAVFFETSEGVVVVDTGMAGAGPVMVEQIRAVTDAPIAAIIFTHGHVDHMTGAWAFVDAGETVPRIIGHENIVPRIQRYSRLRGSIAKYMSQPMHELPAAPDDLVLPTETFSDRFELVIGGERFVIQHVRGETDDQAYVFAEERGVLVSADYYQGFLPNLGNGKRVRRYGSDWIAGLREMAGLGADVMLPLHGMAVVGEEEVSESLTLLADALAHIEQHVVDGLNAGLRKDQIAASVTWPERFANDPRLETYYVTPEDVAKMFLKEWTGWWDDQPAHWSPARVEAQAALIVTLAGGLDAFMDAARQMAGEDIVLASHMADWAFFHAPDRAEVRDFVIEVYTTRLLDPAVTEQEALTYYDHAALVRALQLTDAQIAPAGSAAP